MMNDFQGCAVSTELNRWLDAEDAAHEASNDGAADRKDEIETLAGKYLTEGHADSAEWFCNAEKYLQAFFDYRNDQDTRKDALAEFTRSMERQAERTAAVVLGYEH